MEKGFFNKQLSRNPFPFVVVLTGYIIFHSFFEHLLTVSLINPVFSTVHSSIINDVVVLILVIYFLALIIRQHPRFVPSKLSAGLLCLCSVLYVYYRIVNCPWDFAAFSFLPVLKYVDVLPVLTIVQLLFFIPKGKIEPSITKGGFLEDISLGLKTEDRLGYTEYAWAISARIKSSTVQQAFAIAINAKWGGGKTSFIDLMKRELTGPDIIAMDFNPWNSSNPASIIQDFFDTLQDHISPYDSTLSSLIKSYSKKLVALQENKLTTSFQVGTRLIMGGDSIDAHFDTINATLQSLQKKLIIYIDDLDRLDKHEIVEVIRLIRNTAKFSNTFFIVAFDRNYLLKALEKHNPYNFHFFLEKIFQLEIVLPHFKSNILSSRLFQLLKERLPASLHEHLSEIILGGSVTGQVNFTEWLQTLRDVTRFVNAFTINLELLLGEVELRDFIRIELLRLKYPVVYELLHKRKGQFLTGSDSVYQLSKTKDITFIDVSEKNNTQPYIEYFLNHHQNLYGLDETVIRMITRFLAGIFSDTYSYGLHSKSRLSIVYPDKFDRYFAYSIFDDQLSEKEFSDARNGDLPAFEEKIKEWIKRNLHSAVAAKLEDIKQFESKEDFEKVIRAIFFFSNIEDDPGPFFPTIGFDANNLFDKLGDSREQLSKVIYNTSGGPQGLRGFIKTLLVSAPFPYYYYADFVNTAMEKVLAEHSFPLTFEDLQRINIDYLLWYTQKATSLERQAFRLFVYTFRKDWIPTQSNNYRQEESIPEEARKILQQFITKHLDDYLYMLIETEPFSTELFKVSQSPITLFGSFDAFETFLMDNVNSGSLYLSEFNAFFQLQKSNNFQMMKFNFTVIPVHQKFNN